MQASEAYCMLADPSTKAFVFSCRPLERSLVAGGEWDAVAIPQGVILAVSVLSLSILMGHVYAVRHDYHQLRSPGAR